MLPVRNTEHLTVVSPWWWQWNNRHDKPQQKGCRVLRHRNLIEPCTGRSVLTQTHLLRGRSSIPDGIEALRKKRVGHPRRQRQSEHLFIRISYEIPMQVSLNVAYTSHRRGFGLEPCPHRQPPSPAIRRHPVVTDSRAWAASETEAGLMSHSYKQPTSPRWETGTTPGPLKRLSLLQVNGVLSRISLTAVTSSLSEDSCTCLQRCSLHASFQKEQTVWTVTRVSSHVQNPQLPLQQVRSLTT